MKFILEINCDSAAFENHPKNEIARILRATVERMENEFTSDRQSLFDINGNQVGFWRIEP